MLYQLVLVLLLSGFLITVHHLSLVITRQEREPSPRRSADVAKGLVQDESEDDDFQDLADLSSCGGAGVCLSRDHSKWHGPVSNRTDPIQSPTTMS